VFAGKNNLDTRVKYSVSGSLTPPAQSGTKPAQGEWKAHELLRQRGRHNSWCIGTQVRSRRLPIDTTQAHYLIEFDPPFWSVSVFRNGTVPEIIPAMSLPGATRRGAYYPMPVSSVA
jgi:hypothetical protein